ncbi:hypothetical protein [Mycolicibacter kumamotonensis]|uniref:DUF2188 domain-containing protein n=1 Tax=Mycolicibacter kumamotonensis TaxID=354243 RepID=A0A1B8SL57_9MYCO|nr:hypothetical protein [Mycolicibacter kumamotonensis]OBY33461.1 hypothetical protein ACT18_00480 [Mycolicibacter kumamotonensis]
MSASVPHRIIVHRAGKNWAWTQVSRNGMAAAASPDTYETESNATRAAQRQVDILNGRTGRSRGGVYVEGYAKSAPYAALVVDENYHPRVG